MNIRDASSPIGETTVGARYLQFPCPLPEESVTDNSKSPALALPSSPSLLTSGRVQFLRAGCRLNTGQPVGCAVAWRPMQKVVRISLGIAIVGLVLYAAQLATRDCTVGPYTYDNCLWVWIRAHVDLPASRLMRMATLEFVGIALALAFYFTCRYIFPLRGATPEPQDSSRPHVSGPPAH